MTSGSAGRQLASVRLVGGVERGLQIVDQPGDRRRLERCREALPAMP